MGRRRANDGLHDKSRVGAQHDHLAMRHVDHAHGAEGDGEPDGGQQQHRAERNAIPDILRHLPRGQRLLDRVGGGRGSGLDLAVGGGSDGLQNAERIAVGAVTNQGDRGELLRRRRVGGREHDGGTRLAHRALDARVLFDGKRLVEGRQGRRIPTLEEGVGSAEPDPGIGAHQGERTDRGLDRAAQAVVDAHTLEVGFDGATGRLAGDRFAQRQPVAVDLADDRELVGSADVELAGPQGFEDRRGALFARSRQRGYRRLALAQTAGGEIPDEGREVGRECRSGQCQRCQHGEQGRERAMKKHVL